MADDNKVKLQAYTDLVDPVAGEVQKGDEFETNEVSAKYLVKLHAAGSPGPTPQEIQEEVALEQFAERKEAKSGMVGPRQTLRNLNLSAQQSGHVGVDDPQPQSVVIGKDDTARTNAQIKETADGGADNLGKEKADSSSSSSSKSSSKKNS